MCALWAVFIFTAEEWAVNMARITSPSGPLDCLGVHFRVRWGSECLCANSGSVQLTGRWRLERTTGQPSDCWENILHCWSLKSSWNISLPLKVKTVSLCSINFRARSHFDHTHHIHMIIIYIYITSLKSFSVNTLDNYWHTAHFCPKMALNLCDYNSNRKWHSGSKTSLLEPPC